MKKILAFFKDAKVIVGGIVAIITLTGTGWGAYAWLRTEFPTTAKFETKITEVQSSVEQVSAEVDKLRIQKSLESLYDQFYYLEKKLRQDSNNDGIRLKKDLLDKRIKRLEDRLKELEKLTGDV